MLIDYENRAIFFHNVKCGGVYMRYILQEKYNFVYATTNIHDNYNTFFEKDYPIDKIQEGSVYRHSIRLQGKYRYYQTHQDINLDYYNSFFKFIFVRNPYDKLYSVYCHLKKELKHNNNCKINTIAENSEYYVNFEYFIKNMANVNKLAYFHAFIRQYDQLIDTSGNINFEFIGKVENLENDFIEALTLIGEKNLNHIEDLNLKPNEISNTDLENIINEYTEDVFLFVNDYFDLDFKIFNYKKYNTYAQFKSSFLSKKMREKDITRSEKDVKKEEDVKEKIPYYFVKMTDKTISYNSINKIPKLLIQTYKNEFIHPFIYTNIQRVLKQNPTYSYMFITDEMVIPFIRANFNNQVLKAFLLLKSGAAKSDFIRYIYLYIYGGIYYDLDVDINVNLDEYIKPDADFIFFTTIDTKDHQHSVLEQFIIMISKQNSIMKKIIDEMIIRIFSGEDNIFLTTGPRMFEDVFYNLMENSNIYNIRQTFSTEQKRNFVEKNRKCNYMKYTGYLFNVDYNTVSSKLEAYMDKMLYYDRYKYGELNLSIFTEVMKNKHIKTTQNTTNYNLVDLYKKICLFIISKKKNDNKNRIQDVIHSFENMYLDHLLMNETHELKTFLYTENPFFNSETTHLLEIKDVVYNLYKTHLTSQTQICNKCHHFKTYNKTAFDAHTYFCNSK